MAKAKKIKKTIKTKKTSKSNLTLKQETFCQKFVELMNGTKAALEAGYSPDSAYSIACENLKKPEIKERIAELRKEIEEQFYYSRTMSFKNLIKAQDLAMDNVFIKVTKDGDTIEIPKPDFTAFLKAEELKGKMAGLYEPEIQQEININSMGRIKVNGKPLDLKVGKAPAIEEE